MSGNRMERGSVIHGSPLSRNRSRVSNYRTWKFRSSSFKSRSWNRVSRFDDDECRYGTFIFRSANVTSRSWNRMSRYDDDKFRSDVFNFRSAPVVSRYDDDKSRSDLFKFRFRPVMFRFGHFKSRFHDRECRLDACDSGFRRFMS